MTAALQALAERLTNATGPDREIDAMLEAWAYTLENDAPAEIVCDSDQVERGHYWVRIDGGRTLYSSAPLTASLNAAIALCERVLPDNMRWSISNAAVKSRANVFPLSPTRPIMGPYSSAATPALALCLAIVRARIAEETP